MSLAGFVLSSVVFLGVQTDYSWQSSPEQEYESLARQILPPPDYERESVDPESWAAWLRGLPMKPKGTPIELYNGERKFHQNYHLGVVDIDIGRRDLQQCADAVIRLRAEWLFSQSKLKNIVFLYTGGGWVDFYRWSKGHRPNPKGTIWRPKTKSDKSYKNFRKYLRHVFTYAGTYSLSKQLVSVESGKLQIGDVFIKGAFPGHAVLVADVVVNKTTGDRKFLLLQSYMPAQNVHVLVNPNASTKSPWYPAKITWPLYTPEWTFEKGSLMRWKKG